MKSTYEFVGLSVGATNKRRITHRFSNRQATRFRVRSLRSVRRDVTTVITKREKMFLPGNRYSISGNKTADRLHIYQCHVQQIALENLSVCTRVAPYLPVECGETCAFQSRDWERVRGRALPRGSFTGQKIMGWLYHLADVPLLSSPPPRFSSSFVRFYVCTCARVLYRVCRQSRYNWHTEDYSTRGKESNVSSWFSFPSFDQIPKPNQSQSLDFLTTLALSDY